MLNRLEAMQREIEAMKKELESSTFALTDEQVSELVKEISKDIEDAGIDIVDDFEVELKGKEFKLDSVEFDRRKIKSIVEDSISEVLATFEEANASEE
jgi:hypothetical protein